MGNSPSGALALFGGCCAVMRRTSNNGLFEGLSLLTLPQLASEGYG
uniref:Uncharacterized protein n=1 Tax=uncultured gamma proteobacterium HF0010_05D02 TaxID=710978 RepID=E0XQL7_9GAMM|nr:hypothetical protein [uncultured gamma proteobacterium HF0010_05D02]